MTETTPPETDGSPPNRSTDQDDRTREYLRIEPTDTAIDPKAVYTTFLRLHEFTSQQRDDPGLLSRVAHALGRTQKVPQTVEFLIATDGDSGTSLEYYLGLDASVDPTATDARQRPSPEQSHAETALAGFERVVRSMLPNEYDIERVRWHPGAMLRDRHEPESNPDIEGQGHTPEPVPADDTATEQAGQPASSRSEGASTPDVSSPPTADDSRDGTPTGGDKPTYHALEFVGEASRRADWQTRLVPISAWYDTTGTPQRVESRPPLSAVVETLAASPVPTVYQALVQPLPSWADAASDRRYNLLEGRDGLFDRLLTDLEVGLGEPDHGRRNRERLERRRTRSDDPFDPGGTATRTVDDPLDRIQLIDARDTDRSFVVNARLVTRLHAEPSESTSPTASESTPRHGADHERAVTQLCAELKSAFAAVSGPCHTITARHRTDAAAVGVRDALCDRTVHPPEYERLTTWLPGVAHASRGIVADPREAPVFCLLDGGRLTPTGMAALAPTPGERARPEGPPPSRDVLARYRGPGLTLGTLEPGWQTAVDATGVGLPAVTSQSSDDVDSSAQLESNDADRDASVVVRLPPALQRLHVAWFGKTGSGKTTAATIGLLDNHAATTGATVVIDQKGDGMAEDLLRMKYARDGPSTVDDIVHFDVTRLLPAFSFFDIRDQLAAGVPREVAVADVIAHYVELLIQLKGRDWYYSAPLSAKLIEAVLTAMFDPVHGQDAFSHREFRATLSKMLREQTAPAVCDPETRTILEDAVAADGRQFRNIMNGVLNRVDEVSNETYLNTVLNHVGPAPQTTSHPGHMEHDDAHEHHDDAHDDARDEQRADSTTDADALPSFEFGDILDENVIVVFDMGGIREEAQRALTILVVSKLWTALRRRTHRRQQQYGHDRRPHDDTDTDPTTTSDPATAALPLVNLFVEEASKVAASGVVTDLLKQARSFGCAVTLSMQYPAQLKHTDTETYTEVLNNVSTIVTGNVPLDRDLAARLATSDMEPQEVANRLRALSRGEWLCALPAGYGEVEPRPFVLDSAPLPPGHPDGPQPLSASDQSQLEIDQRRRDDRLQREYGLALPTVATTEQGDGAEDSSTDGSPDAEADDSTSAHLSRFDTVLPYTQRLPETITYAEERHAIDCTECGTRYDPSSAGMQRAISCCSSLAETDPDDIPITTVNLKLTPEERAETGLSDRQLVLLQVIHNAQQLRYDPPEYDLLHDSMKRLLEYVGASTADVQSLIDDGYLTLDATHPHCLYSVTPAGRSVIGEAYRHGVDFGHGKGDLGEKSLHVLMVEVGYRHLVDAYRDNPDSPVTEVIKYFEIDRASADTDRASDPDPTNSRGVDAADGTAPDERANNPRRMDAVGLDADGTVVVTLEAERVNHDLSRAVPRDFDKMAACEPEEAIWICWTQKEGSKIIRALNDPLDGAPRVEKSYSPTTPPHQYRIDTPGLTAMYSVEYLRNRLGDARD